MPSLVGSEMCIRDRHAPFARIKRVHEIEPLFYRCAAIQAQAFYMAILQSRIDTVQHGSELREQKYTMSRIQCVFQHFEQLLEFSASRPASRFHELRITAYLT